MGKASLLAIIAFGVMGAMYAVSMQNGALSAEKRVADSQYEVLARNAAVAGHSQARQKLADEFNNYQFTGTYDGIPYDAEVGVDGVVLNLHGETVNVNAEEAAILSIGRATGTQDQEIRYSMQTVYEIEEFVEIEDEAPPFMRYALMSDSDLTVQGNVDAHVYADGDEANKLNADVHTNGHLEVNGSASTVRGFGTHSGGYSNTGQDNTFQPNYNPSNDPEVQSVDRVEIPEFNMDAFLDKIDGANRTVTGDMTLEGDIDFGGTRDNPFVVHVTGNLDASGGSSVHGYTLFLVDGAIDITGNAQGGNGGYDGRDESNVGFYSAGDVRLGGNTEIYGQVYAQGDLTFHGTPAIYGSVTARGTAELKGTPDLYYRNASPALTTIWNEPEQRLKRISHKEW